MMRAEPDGGMHMKRMKLGRSGIEVSAVALGTWGLGGGSVWSDRPAEGRTARSGSSLR